MTRVLHRPTRKPAQDNMTVLRELAREADIRDVRLTRAAIRVHDERKRAQA